jgi:deazaflavin-dependent oxidoreductase (nitroreductase family)
MSLASQLDPNLELALRAVADENHASARDSREERLALTRSSSGGRTGFIILRGAWGRVIDRALVRWTGWSLITWQYARASGRRYQPTLLLTTIGRRTGQLRSSALPYFPLDGDLIVCGSRGGGPYDPLWTANLAADPHCWLRIRRRLVPATGRVVRGEERAVLFEKVARHHGGLRRYQEQASAYGREIPLVALTPRAEVSGL